VLYQAAKTIITPQFISVNTKIAFFIIYQKSKKQKGKKEKKAVSLRSYFSPFSAL